jgi:hypothetical protein
VHLLAAEHLQPEEDATTRIMMRAMHHAAALVVGLHKYMRF